jgi:hypothetical protein
MLVPYPNLQLRSARPRLGLAALILPKSSIHQYFGMLFSRCKYRLLHVHQVRLDVALDGCLHNRFSCFSLITIQLLSASFSSYLELSVLWPSCICPSLPDTWYHSIKQVLPCRRYHRLPSRLRFIRHVQTVSFSQAAIDVHSTTCQFAH